MTTDVLAVRMRLGKHLVGSLSEIVDDSSDNSPFLRISYIVQIDGTVVGEVMEDVQVLDRSVTSLLVPKNEIDPIMELFRDVWALQSLSMLRNKDFRISFGPPGQYYVVHLAPVLTPAEVVPVSVGQKLWETEEFGNEFSDISAIVARGGLPSSLDGEEGSIRVIEVPTLEQ